MRLVASRGKKLNPKLLKKSKNCLSPFTLNPLQLGGKGTRAVGTYRQHHARDVRSLRQREPVLLRVECGCAWIGDGQRLWSGWVGERYRRGGM
mgnify:CR=1 FL=1